MLRRWQAMQVTATASVVVLAMLVTSTFSLLVRMSRPGPNPFDIATFGLAGYAIWLLVRPMLPAKKPYTPPPDIWDA